MFSQGPRKEIDIWLSYKPWQRHGIAILISGLFMTFYGFSLLRDGPEFDRNVDMMRVAIRLFPLDFWAAIFVVAGLGSAIFSRFKKFRPPWAYSVFCGLAGTWTAQYFAGYILVDGPPRSLYYGSLWACLLGIWWAVSGMVNPDKSGRPSVWLRRKGR